MQKVLGVDLATCTHTQHNTFLEEKAIAKKTFYNKKAITHKVELLN